MAQVPWQFQDVKSEVDLACTAMFTYTVPQNVNTMTMCPSHHSSLRLGWTRATERCRTHPEISEHRNVRGKWPKADRGIKKNFSQFIMERTGHLVHVGSGRYFDVPLVLIFFTWCKHFDQLLIVSGMCRRWREILCSFSEEEKLPKLWKKRNRLQLRKELTMVKGIVLNYSPL